MNYEIIIHFQTRFVDFLSSTHCHTLDDASRTFRYYVGRPNVAAVRLFQERQLIWEMQKGGLNHE